MRAYGFPWLAEGIPGVTLAPELPGDVACESEGISIRVEAASARRANGLRHKVRLQADGGLKTGLDVIKAAILGAESFGFGTAPMVALGCKYLRICHLNNCATGVATQAKVLRLKHFIGLPEMVMNYFKFVAEETREAVGS